MTDGGGDRLRVGVNLLWLVPGVVGGSEELMVRLLGGLAELAPDDLDVELFALEDLVRAHPELVEAFPTTTVALRGRAKPLRVAAETTWLPARARRRRLDLVHHAGGVVPLVRGTPSVVTVHDLQPLDQPQNFSRVKVAYLRAMLPRTVRAARLVLTPSRAAADRVVDRLGVPRERLRVVPHGLDPSLLEPVAEEEVARVRQRYDLGPRWIAYPVITYPHKNHRVLVEAFARLATVHPDLHLVLPGGVGPAEGEVAAAIAAHDHRDRIHRLGRVPRADLDALLAGAVAVAFPSRYEGFGNAALEAMALGTPVVAADATALPEVVGEAGDLVGPDDVEGWAAALGRILDDPDRAARMAAAGRARARGRTGLASARELAAAYRDAATAGGGGGPDSGTTVTGG